MGLFSKLEITIEDSKKINSLLPKKHQKDKWEVDDLISGNSEIPGRLYQRFQQLVNTLEKEISDSTKRFKSLKDDLPSLLVSKVKIFNSEIYEARPIGMVDIGLVRKFTTTGTGNRFETGLIGYAIEGAIDAQWAKSNVQFDSVQEAKKELIIKALNIYPDTNLIFKFEIDFRELGSSGNVFIYIRGTACKGSNPYLDTAKKELETERKELEVLITNLESELKELKRIKGSIPKNKLEVKQFLNKN